MTPSRPASPARSAPPRPPREAPAGELFEDIDDELWELAHDPARTGPPLEITITDDGRIIFHEEDGDRVIDGTAPAGTERDQ